MINPTMPILADQLLTLELPNGQFVRVDTNVDANNNYRVELLDQTGEFMAGLESEALD